MEPRRTGTPFSRSPLLPAPRSPPTGVPTPHALANLEFKLLAAAVGAILHGWLRAGRRGRPSVPADESGASPSLHADILAGAFISMAGMGALLSALAIPNERFKAGGLEATISGCIRSPGMGQVYMPSQAVVAPEYSGLHTLVEIREGAVIHPGTLWMYEYVNYGVVSEPLVISTPTRDLYVSMHQPNSSFTALVQALVGNTTPPRDVTVAVKTVPLIWLVWLGVLMMVVGMSVVFLDELLGSGWLGRARSSHSQTDASSAGSTASRERTASRAKKRVQ